MDAKVMILGVPVDKLSVSELHRKILAYTSEKMHARVLHVNVYGLNLAYEEGWLREFLRSADTVFCDGAGVKLGAYILGDSLPQRITYADWMWQLSSFTQENHLSIFFLGGRPGVADKAAMKLRKRFPDLRIVGVHHGYFEKHPGSQENENVLQQINRTHPNILIVGFGMPLQEKWLMENWGRIDADVALTGGAVFDYISGDLQRAPKWMTDNGLEWLGRLLIEPRRLWKRYVVGNPLFLWRVLKQRFGWLKLE
jgi:N-acetylglucosaminyldiphosphoundecaprenol N-acetyl-beta-D-mannosaminyltransferase